MSERTVFHVVPNANSWEVKQAGVDATVALVDDKDRAIELAAEHAKAAGLGQIVIHNRDGRIAGERTYGEDPRDIPG